MHFGYGFGMNRYGYGFRYGLASARSCGTSGAVQAPYAAHVAAMQGIDPSGKYVLADPSHYAASLSQAGVFFDAFGSAFTYAAPNVRASLTAVQDPTSGLWYASADGADDRAVGSAAETVMRSTALLRSPPGQDTWSTFGGILMMLRTPATVWIFAICKPPRSTATALLSASIVQQTEAKIMRFFGPLIATNP